MSTPTPQHDAWVHSALGVNPADFASPPPAGPNGGGSTQDHTAECDRFLKDHHFNATKSEEIVPGDMQCDLWLDDHLVKRQDVQAALTQAIPALQNDPIWVAHYVADHWDQEIKKALLQSGALLLQPAELYDKGYADGQKDRPRAALRDRILREVQDNNPKKDDLLADIGELATHDMKFV